MEVYTVPTQKKYDIMRYILVNFYFRKKQK